MIRLRQKDNLNPEYALELRREGAKVLLHRDPYGVNEVLAQVLEEATMIGYC